MAIIYRRTSLAMQMARKLLRPGVLDEGWRSGLFLSGVRRTGKTTFLLNDLIPALEADGAIVIYVDLWSDVQTSPATLVHQAIRKALAELQAPTSALLAKLRNVKGASFEVHGFKFGFDLQAVGAAGGMTLAEALRQVVDQAQADVVLVVDEVQHALTSDEGAQLMLALKAARDAINPRPDTPGHFLFVGTGSHRAHVSEMSARRNQAFAGATSLDYPLLDADYVQHVLDRLHGDDSAWLPSPEATVRAFRTLGHRPEELLTALRLLRSQLPAGARADDLIGVIAATLRTTAADLELMKVEQLGGLAMAVFERIVSSEGERPGLFTTEAMSAYASALGHEVRKDEVQTVVNALVSANVVMRRAHGVYGVTDPFVQEIWREKKALAEGF